MERIQYCLMRVLSKYLKFIINVKFIFSDLRWLSLVWHACAKPIKAVHSVCWKSSGRHSWKLGWTAQSQETRTSTSTSCIPPVPSSACTAGISSSPSSPHPPTGGSQSLEASADESSSRQQSRNEKRTTHDAYCTQKWQGLAEITFNFSLIGWLPVTRSQGALVFITLLLRKVVCKLPGFYRELFRRIWQSLREINFWKSLLKTFNNTKTRYT